jgi:hypothetical protein
VTEIDAHARVLSEDVVASPLTGTRGAFVHIELFEEQGASLSRLGHLTLGDVVRFAFEDAPETVAILIRRAECSFPAEDTPLGRFVPELAGLLTRARGGVLRVRERVVARGDRVRIRANVESGHVRYDLGPVRVEAPM